MSKRANADEATPDSVPPDSVPNGGPLGPWLWITVLVTGSVIMIVELLGTKIIAPYYGSSVYTWTALIATTMGALSLGYQFGGILADGELTPKRFYTLIAGAGAYLLLVPLIQHPVLSATGALGLRLGALAAAMAFFALPLGLLGMVAPSAVKLAMRERERLGATVGGLYAVSTWGSMAGTIATGFFLIPNFGNFQILLGCAAALLLLSGAFFVTHGERGHATAAAALALTTLPLHSLAGPKEVWAAPDGGTMEVVDRSNSNYGDVCVIDTSAGEGEVFRGLFIDGMCHNRIAVKAQSSASRFSYMIAGLASQYVPAPERVLCMGIGAGILPMDYARAGAKVDAVEINGPGLELARKHFGYGHPNLTTYVEDARWFVAGAEGTYDLIVMDCFGGDSVPTHLLTREYFEELDGLLAPGGALVINTLGTPRGAGAPAMQAVYSTLSAAFPHVYAFGLDGEEVTNVYFCASHELPQHNIQIRGLPDQLAPIVQETLQSLLALEVQDELVLTDNDNPFEVLALPSQERLRAAIREQPYRRLLL